MPGANSFIQEGEVLDWTNNTGTDVAYRDVIPSGGRIFIAGENIANGASGSVNCEGVWELPADNTTAFVVGDVLYWDNAAGKITKTAGTYRAGYCTAPKAQADTTSLVKIDF
jgi:Uncharacterized conserved protein